MTSGSTEQLAELIRKEHECLLAMRDLSRRQLALVESDDLTGLLKVLTAKGHLVNMLQTIQSEMEPFRKQDPDGRHWPSPQQRQQSARLSAASSELLREIVEVEKQSESRMRIRRDEAAARLQGAHVAQNARDAYAARPGANPGMLDVSSEQ